MRLKLKTMAALMLFVPNVCALAPMVNAWSGTNRRGRRDSRGWSESAVVINMPNARPISLMQMAITRDLERLKAAMIFYSHFVISASRDESKNNVWHILVANKEFDFIGRLLGTVPDSDLGPEVTQKCLESFCECVGQKNIYNGSPLDSSIATGTLDDLRKCIPSVMPEKLRRLLPGLLKGEACRL